MGSEGGSEFREVLRRRTSFLDLLVEEALPKRDIIERLDTSRSTADRAIKRLEDAGLVERTEAGYRATAAGRMALDRHREYVRTLGSIEDATGVLDPLAPDCDLDAEAIVGGEAYPATGPAPYRPVERLHDDVAGADRYRAVLPVLDDPRHVRLCYEHVVTEGRPAELVVSRGLLDTLREEFPRRIAAMADTPEFEVRVGETPDFGLVLTEGERTTASIVVFGEDGTVNGVVRNRSADAIEWAESYYERVRSGTADATDSLEPDLGRRTRSDGATTWMGRDEALPIDLERQGFRRIDPAYFADAAAASPTVAWRTGLDLAEVQTGYAADRTWEVDGQRRPLADDLEDRLRDGTDVALIGPPGSGKSTVCKQVACRWYREDRGHVYYRESGRGRAFESVEALTDAVEADPGRTLVVVEDAVRPESRAVLDAVDAFADREEVVFLLDARTEEWHDPPGERPDAAEAARRRLDVVSMPPLLDADVERLVETVERTTGERIDVPIDRLREDLAAGFDADDGAAPGEVVLLLHRLSLYADPLGGEDATTLREDARAVYEELAGADRDVALDVGVVCNLLNAAGVAIHPAYVHALVATGEDEDAVERALERLEGRVVFESDGPEAVYRAVHETWSTAFLSHLLDADGAAADRVDRCATALLSLAEEGTREEVRSALEVPEWLEEDPAGWADETVESLYALGLDRPKLAPLFGDPGDPGIELPAACDPELDLRRVESLGRMYLHGGFLEEAEEAFETLTERADDAAVSADRAEEFRAASLKYRGTIARKRGNLDAAEERYRESLERYRDLDHEEGVAAGLINLGSVAYDRGNLETAEEYFERSLERYRDLEYDRGEANSLLNLSAVGGSTGDLEVAQRRLERALEIHRSLGRTREAAQALNNLGWIATKRSAYEEAEEYLRRSLERKRAVGDREKQATTLSNLSEIARKRGDLDAATEYVREGIDLCREIDADQWLTNQRLERARIRHARGDLDGSEGIAREAIDTYRDRDDVAGEASARLLLGRIARDRGDLDAAERYAREGLECYREADIEEGRADCLGLLAEIARDRGDLAAAEETIQDALEVYRDIDAKRGVGLSYCVLGDVLRRRGRLNLAEERLVEAIEVAREVGDDRSEARVLRRLGELALARDDPETARDRFADAAEAYRECGSHRDALDTMERVIDLLEGDAAIEWCERAIRLTEESDVLDAERELRDRKERLVE